MLRAIRNASCAAGLVATMCLSAPVPAVGAPVGLTNPGLGGVVALSPTDAWAVGANHEGPHETVLIEHWDGSTWSVDHVPRLLGGLYAISATSASDVWAVGYSSASGSLPFRTLTMHWDGSRWSRVPSPNLGSNPATILLGVSARTPGDVWAVGESTTKRAVPVVIALHWAGTSWSKLETIGNSSSPVDGLEGVATPTAHEVVAVGYCEKTDPHCPSHANSSAVYEHSTHGWAPATTHNFGMLYGVSALGPADIWAAGQRGVVHFDGSTWTHVDGAVEGEVVDVDAISPRLVVAVGLGDAETWNGRSWRQVSTAGVGTVSSVSLDSSTDGWAVGINGGDVLFEHWDGTGFTQYPST